MAEIRENLYDVVIIGGGPAGLTAALYLARARYRVIVLEKERFGGQITITAEVVNYPGVGKISGAALTETMRRQAEGFGAQFMLSEATGLELSKEVKEIRTSRGTLYCFGVLLATGAHPRRIGFRGEEEYRGRGVAYCATCDGEFFTGSDVFVVGGGFAAAEESVFLTKYAKHVTVLIRGEDFKCAKSAADAARNHEKITVLTNMQILEVFGDSTVRGLRYQNTLTKEVTEYKAPDRERLGVFVFAGYEPATACVQGIVDMDEQGYVKTDRQQKTSVDGVYAAGDVCIKNLRQVVTAVGDGAIAATELEHYAAALQKQTGLYPVAPAMPAQEEAGRPQEDSKKSDKEKAENTGGLFTEDMKKQLLSVFEKMQQPLILRLFLDSRPVSLELKAYMEAMAELTDLLSVEIAEDFREEETPCVRVLFRDGTDTGLAFHGVPGGHEFTSFVLGLYNASGPGQTVDTQIAEQIQAVDYPVDMKIMVSLSCTMCPELVIAAQKIAAVNPHVRTDIYDLNHFPERKEKYQVMSVPCMVINDDKVSFGKKNLEELLQIIREWKESQT